MELKRGNNNSVRPYDPEKQLITQSLILDMDISIEGLVDEKVVYKLFYNNKYIIIKGKSLSGSIFLFKKGFSYYIGYEHSEGSKHSDFLYVQFYEHIKTYPGHSFYISILSYGSPYELLKAEQIALNQAIHDKNCLNTNIDAYIPKWNPKSKMYGGWISKSAYMNYKKFLKYSTFTTPKSQ